MDIISKAAILGYGVVGSGTAEMLAKNETHILMKSGCQISLGYILDVRSFPESPFADKFVTDYTIILQDPQVSVVVETIGGAGTALEFTRRALEAGKSVVTSNKELVAAHGYELLQLAKKHHVKYLFEASVGGGIPIIRPLSQCLLGNQIEEVYGILNGTTNYILTQMFENGVPFDRALKRAQELGYAERNPDDDVLGKDVSRKIAILASLVFGYQVDPQEILTEGIQNIQLEDVRWAEEQGYRIKLLGRTVRIDQQHITAYVAPHLIHSDHLLAQVRDVYNGITVCGDAVGDVMFYGRGAGKFPTASAVVADVIDAVKGESQYVAWAPPRAGFLVSPDQLEGVWYARGAGIVEEKPVNTFGIRVYGQ